MLPGSNNILCRSPIDALRPCIYLVCHLRKRFIVLFRLATGWLLLRTAPFQNFRVSVLPNRAKQLPGPLAIGSCDPLLFGLQAGSKACSGPLGRQRGPQEFSLSHKGDNPWTFGTTNLSWRRSSRTRSIAFVCLFQLRENKYLAFLIDLLYRVYLERQ